MLKVVLVLLCLFPVAFSQGCLTCSSEVAAADGTQITYGYSDALITNPERGGAVLKNSYADHGLGETNPLSAVILSDLVEAYPGISLVWRMYYLDFTTTIAPTYLTVIHNDFDFLKAAGFKAIIRFAYTNDPNIDQSTEQTPAIIEDHIDQLTTIIQQNTDVILSVQIGFIGVYGEWLQSTHFGDAGGILPDQWDERTAVADKLLAAVPTSRTVQIRTPAQKKVVADSPDALTLSDYRDYSKKSARIGHHNDCFLSSVDDSGTYIEVDAEYLYLAQDTKFVPMGGQTCKVDAPRSECAKAKEELEMFHWTYLNLAEDTDVLASWKSGKCYDEIISKLGYRLSLTEAVFPDTVVANAFACFTIKFKNNGYAAPINPREVRLVLRSSGNSTNYTSEHIPEFTDAEPWLPESGEITVNFNLKVNVPAGDYHMLLELSDPLLYGNPLYNIILANKGTAELAEGLNNLQHTLTVTAGSASDGLCEGFTSKGSTTASTGIRCSASCKDLQFAEETIKEEDKEDGAVPLRFSITTISMAALAVWFLNSH